MALLKAQNIKRLGYRKSEILFKMPCSYIKNCASCVGGQHIFRKVMKKSRQKIKNGAKKRLDGKYDGCMRGLDGAERRKC